MFLIQNLLYSSNENNLINFILYLWKLSKEFKNLINDKNFENKRRKKYKKKYHKKTIKGRLLLNFWKIIKEEKKLLCYTLTNIIKEILNKNIPKISQKTLMNFYNKKNISEISNYFLKNLKYSELSIYKINYIQFSEEFTKLYGILIKNIERG